jgi:predicted DNA-binding antitoxin AbrB/MazE fold protein
MSVIVEATYQNGAFKSVQPVSLPEGAKVRLVITPIADQDTLVVTPSACKCRIPRQVRERKCLKTGQRNQMESPPTLS